MQDKRLKALYLQLVKRVKRERQRRRLKTQC